MVLFFLLALCPVKFFDIAILMMGRQVIMILIRINFEFFVFYKIMQDFQKVWKTYLDPNGFSLSFFSFANLLSWRFHNLTFSLPLAFFVKVKLKFDQYF
jgi:hypothetical protein